MNRLKIFLVRNLSVFPSLPVCFSKIKTGKKFSWKQFSLQNAKCRLHFRIKILNFGEWLQRSSISRFNCGLHYLKNLQTYAPLLQYSTWVGIRLFFILQQIHKISTCCLEKCLLSSVWIKGNNLVCNELVMLKIPVDVFETLFNVVD